jgi:transcriptional regulator with XRE-family HTH domain
MMALKEMRKKAGLSQSELAAVSGVKLRAIQVYEIGQRDINGAKLDTLCKLALALNCKVYDIITDEQLKVKLKKTV